MAELNCVVGRGKVLILRSDLKSGGIVLPGASKENQGRVVAVGADAYQNGSPVPSVARQHIGDEAVFAKAYETEIDRVKYLVAEESDIFCFLPAPEAVLSAH